MCTHTQTVLSSQSPSAVYSFVSLVTAQTVYKAFLEEVDLVMCQVSFPYSFNSWATNFMIGHISCEQNVECRL